MSPLDFVTWLKGFVKAANSYNITPKQWDYICEELEKVRINENTQSNKMIDVSYTKNSSSTNTILHD